ncbi:xanthine dehydrogenase accessory factor [Paenibacillus sp. 1_12]|uniref:XdhC family protein n=1 Tax=Paenibacillus sp. 1_12 TaxID=1566278 RepID=UPI0008ED3A97|nr:XdhC/CoxI family protein [Paenibacillus sp. 1_12]SFM43708.1 xanthine dehydrogenase accessory factor [Paenibacillus sp. 1_12]
MEEIHRILETIQRIDLRSVLATITQVEGSTYRKEGASMLFLEDGSQLGVLSAGCLEAHLSACVPDILETGVSRSFVFDMQSFEPLSWGEEPGCGGVVHVTMEPVHDVFVDHLYTLKHYLDQQIEVILVKRFGSDGSVTDYGFLTTDRHQFGEWRGEFPKSLIHLMSSEDSRRSGMRFVSSIQSDIFVHTYYPKPRLIIFGAGPDARPLAALAAATGYAVVVSDWRPALCDRRYFPDAESFILGFPEETMKMTHFTPDDHAVVMTHNFRRDQQLVQLLAERQLCYLGILGSKSRTERLLTGMPVPMKVYSPIGLAIGAEGPEEIAVSIVAELILRKNKKQEVVNHETE